MKFVKIPRQGPRGIQDSRFGFDEVAVAVKREAKLETIRCILIDRRRDIICVSYGMIYNRRHYT